MDLNKVMLIGRLTRDPELRTTPSGQSVCQFSLATGRSYTNQQSGQRVDQTEFHNIVLWAKLGEIANQYLKKGQQVYIEGRLQTRNWEGQDGQKKYRTEIIAENMIMLGSKGESSVPTSSPTPTSDTKNNAVGELPTIQQDEEINVDDIPF